MLENQINRFNSFRNQLHGIFPLRSDALMNLIDATAGNTSAKSVVELSLSPLFPRSYGSIHDAIENAFGSCNKGSQHVQNKERLQRLIAQQIPLPCKRAFYLFGLDTTPAPRPFANTLEDRGVVYQPNPTLNNKPIAVGHSFSLFAAHPEKTNAHTAPWVVPLSIMRVPTAETATDIGAKQVKAIMTDASLPFGNELSVLVGDTAYSAVKFLTKVVTNKNLVTIARVRGDRVFYKSPPQSEASNGRGHPTWYGERFDLKDPNTWGTPEEVVTTTSTTKKGRELVVLMEAWFDMLMLGKFDYPMHENPFTLIRVTVTDQDGNLVFNRPLWLIVMGERRNEVSLIDAREAYAQRYDLEHFFRFGKNRLLMSAYQTPEVKHEENWWDLVGLAYTQLWLASPLVKIMPRPWERYAFSRNISRSANPSAAQRDFGRLIRQFGTPAALPKPRGKSPGRQSGQSPGRRKRLPVVIKAKKRSRGPP